MTGLVMSAATLFLSMGQVKADELDKLASPHWVAELETSATELLDLITKAYDLDQDMQEVVRAELERRQVEQLHYVQLASQELQEISEKAVAAGLRDGSPEVEAAIKKVTEISSSMPLSPELVADAMDDFLPPEVAQRGRVRFKELLHRKDNISLVRDSDLQHRAGMKTAIRQAMNRNAVLSAKGKPVPVGLEHTVAEVRTTKMIPVRPPPKATKPQPLTKLDVLPPIPPLDDWVKYTFEVDRRYGFSDAQKAQAQSILTDLYVRAHRYLKSQPGAYEALEKTKSKVEYRKLLRQRKLDVTFDALFHELKQRLEKLPTSEQRQKATAKSR
ncbi:MAG: hypothetical protein MI923_10185 [Phycisphaerales bacterium]|nr:hypothetical protein [Phycisphaerales bacterium]